MTEYRCRSCRKMLFRAKGLKYEALEAKCPRCGVVSTPHVTGPMQGEYECASCGTRTFCERPPQDIDFCVRCGVTMAPAKTRAPTRAGIAA